MGVISLGLSTMVQPASSAGAILAAIWFNGQFHGVMAPTTPMGSLTTTVGPRSTDHSYSSTASNAPFTWNGKQGVCARSAKRRGAPSSCSSAAATSPCSAPNSSRTRRM